MTQSRNGWRFFRRLDRERFRQDANFSDPFSALDLRNEPKPPPKGKSAQESHRPFPDRGIALTVFEVAETAHREVDQKDEECRRHDRGKNGKGCREILNFRE